MIKNNIPTEKKEKVLVSTLNGTFFHEKTNSGFIQVNRIEGNSVQNGTPTPDNPIEVKSFEGEVVTSGKNLIDMEYLMNYFNTKLGKTVISKEADGSYKFAFNTSKDPFNYVIPITLDKNKRYAMRCKYKCPNPGWGSDFKFKFTDGTYGAVEEYNVNDYKEKAYVIPKGKVIESFYINSANGTGNLSYYKDFQLEVLEEGQEAPSEYESFHATKTEKITLRSIEGCKDLLERQTDGSYLLTKNIDVKVFDGTESLGQDTFEDGKYGYWLNDYFYGDFSQFGSFRYVKSNYFRTEENYDKNNYGIQFAFFPDHPDHAFIRWSYHEISSVDDMKAKLKEWYDAGKPLTVIYRLPTPIQRKVWLSPLSAYEGMTNIFTNSEVGAEMEVEVLTTNAVNGKLHELKENILQERPNPNLLVNSDFRNPINTTGKKEWINYSAWDKVLNGWNINNVDSTVLLTENGVKVKQSSELNYATFGQYFDIENSKNIMGKKVTLSFYCRDLNAINFRIMFYIAPNYHVNKVWFKEIDVKLGFNKVTIDIPIKEGNIFAVYFYSEGKSSFFELEWVKLELGDKATPLPYEDSKLNQLKTDGVPLLYGGEEILANADLNSYVNIGNYFCQLDSTATTLKNKPSSLVRAFTMTVKSATGLPIIVGTSVFYLQVLETRYGETFKRTITLHDGNYTFGEWRGVGMGIKSIIWFPAKKISTPTDNTGYYVEHTIPKGLDDLENICLLCGWGGNTSNGSPTCETNLYKAYLNSSSKNANADAYFGSETLIGNGLLQLIKNLPIGTEKQIAILKGSSGSGSVWITMNVVQVGADFVKLKYGFFKKESYIIDNISILGYQPK